jgi:Tfp pilus assembly protein PilF
MILGLATIFLTACLARQCAGPLAGLVAAALQTGFWAGPYYEGRWLETAPLTLLLLGALSVAIGFQGRPASARSLLAGAALGLAGLMRPNAFILAPILYLWMRGACRRTGEWRAPWAKSLGFLLLSLGVILVPLVRNRLAGGEWVPISTNAGVNLLLGTERASTLSHGNGLTGDWSCFDAPKLVQRVSEEAEMELKPGEASRRLSRIAWAIHWADPIGALRLAGWKALLFWTPDEVSNNGEEEIERSTSPILSRLPVSFAVLLGLGVAGFVMWLGFGLDAERRSPEADPRSRRSGALILIVAGVYFGSFIPFVIAGQYRVPLAPLLAVAVGVGVETARRLWVAGRRSAFALCLVLMAGFVILVRVNPVRVAPDWSRWHYMRGQMYARAGQYGLEEAEYLLALRAEPDRAEVLLNLGILYYGQKKSQAVPLLRRVNQIRENALANLYLGRIEQEVGSLDKALISFQTAEALNPDGADAPYRQGLLRMEMGEPSAAVEAFARAWALDPAFEEARFGLGWALLESGRPVEAWTCFEPLALAHPVNPAVWYQGGRVLLALGRIEEARFWWMNYLQAVPEDEETRQELQRMK